MPTLPMIPLPDGDRWMPAKEVGLLLGVNRETVCRYYRLGLIKGIKPAKKLFFRKSDVNVYLKSRDLPTMP